MENTQNPQIQSSQSNTAYFAFLYVLSLIALGFMAVSAGTIIFQIINKFVPDSLAPQYMACFRSGEIKFAISAFIVASPIYYIAASRINKHLSKGELKKESQIRKWLTYFIILVSFLVIIGNLIAIVYSFLDGEITARFILKILTMFAISGSVLSYYFYDIKREIETGAKNKVIKLYFYISLAAVIAIAIAALFLAESPAQSRKRKQDAKIIERLDKINRAIDAYYSENRKLPENLEAIANKANVKYYVEEISKEDLENIEYKIKPDNKYDLCAEFQTSNNNANKCYDYWFDQNWQHNAGYQCIEKEVYPAPITELEPTAK